MISLSVGSVFLWSLAFRIRLLPRWLSAWGVVGYAMFLVGAIAEIFGLHISLALSIPGGLFELALGVWLIVKGFSPTAVAGEAAPRPAANVRPALATR